MGCDFSHDKADNFQLANRRECARHHQAHGHCTVLRRIDRLLAWTQRHQKPECQCEYTGLSEEAVERLHIGLDHFICDGEAMCEKARAKNLHTASKLIASREFSELVSRLAYAQEAALSQQLLQLIYEQHTESANNSDDLDEDCAFVFANPEDRVLTERTIQYLVLRKWGDDERCQKIHEMDDEELLCCVIDGVVSNRDDCELYQFHASKELNRYIDRLIEEANERAARDFPANLISSQK